MAKNKKKMTFAEHLAKQGGPQIIQGKAHFDLGGMFGSIFGGAQNQYNPQSAYAPGTQATVNNFQPGLQTGYNAYERADTGLTNTANQLQNVALGQGPNPAQAMLAQTTGANVANQAALMAGQRGASANSGLLARQAAQQGANTQQQAVGQGATLQANQSLNALNNMGNIYGTQAGAANQFYGTNVSGLNNQNANIAGARTAQNEIGSKIAGQNAQANQQMIGGIANAGMGLLGGFAHGGQIGHYDEGGKVAPFAGYGQAPSDPFSAAFGFNFVNGGKPKPKDPMKGASNAIAPVQGVQGGNQWAGNDQMNVPMAAKGGMAHYDEGGQTVAQGMQNAFGANQQNNQYHPDDDFFTKVKKALSGQEAGAVAAPVYKSKGGHVHDKGVHLSTDKHDKGVSDVGYKTQEWTERKRHEKIEEPDEYTKNRTEDMGYEIKNEHQRKLMELKKLNPHLKGLFEGGQVKGVHKSDMGVSHPKNKTEKSWAGESEAGQGLRNSDINAAGKHKAFSKHAKVIAELKALNPKLKGLAKGGELLPFSPTFVQGYRQGGQVPMPSVDTGVSDYRTGGFIAPKNEHEMPKVAGNSLKNDTIPAMLTAHEIVIPKEISMGPNPVKEGAEFIQHTLQKSAPEYHAGRLWEDVLKGKHRRKK